MKHKFLDLRQASILGDALAPMLRSADGVLYGVEQLKSGAVGYLIPPKSSRTFSMKGFCMDKSLPAAAGGHPLRLFRTERMISGELLPIFKSISEKALKAPDGLHFNIQGLVWAIRALDEHPDWDFKINPEQAKFAESAYPGSVALLKRYNDSAKFASEVSGMITKAIKKKFDLPGYGGIPVNPADPNSVQQALNRLFNAGQQNQSQISGSSYSLLAPNVAAMSMSPGWLQANVRVLNDSEQPFLFRPADYIAEAAVPTQRILFNRVTRVDGSSYTDDLAILSRIGQGYLTELDSAKQWAKGIKSFLFPYASNPSLISALRSDALKSGIEAVPLLGNILSAKEALEGRNWVTGTELSPAERMLAILGTVPGYGSAEALLKPIGKTVADVAVPLLRDVSVDQHYKDIAGWLSSDTAVEAIKSAKEYRDIAVTRSISFITPITQSTLARLLPAAT